MEESFTKRVFLGWEKPLVAESVNWLIQHYPEGFENLVIGVPEAELDGKSESS